MKNQTRRQFLQVVGVGAVVSLTPATQNIIDEGRETKDEGRIVRHPSSIVHRFQMKLGLASYTFKKFSLDETLSAANRLGLKYIALKDFHLSLKSTPAECEKVAATVKKAGIELYGCGVIYMKNDNEVNQAFDYAKAAGVKVIIGSPEHELLPLVNKKVQEYDIKLAIHNHGPTDKNYPTPSSVYELIKDLDKRIGLCNDIGHTMRAGADPAETIEKFSDRLLDVHIKDVTAATAKGQTVEVGRGVIDIPKVVKVLLKIGYVGVVSFEYEKDADNPLAGLAESVGFVRGVLAAVS
jgi:sugar phosphate isomerase/epimerase